MTNSLSMGGGYSYNSNKYFCRFWIKVHMRVRLFISHFKTYLSTLPLLITFLGEDWLSKLVPGIQ